jgi:RNA polymerase sigma-70 factor, ECF subfamily
MLRAWRRWAQFSDEKGSVGGCLIRVAHNIAMDKFRMRRSRPVEAPGGPVAGHAGAVVTALHVRRALAYLSRDHRDVLGEVCLNGFTAREAAARLGIPEGRAFSRSCYALRILRRELGIPPAGSQHQAG